MGSQLTLSVVDQSPLRAGGSAADALRESVELAQATEKLGYRRYWVAEHHNTGSFSGTSPEMLIGQIAARTRSIRVGSGGVMLSHYSALKVAEQFRVLESFYPNRIDLGIGRAPGSDPWTADALAHPRPKADIRQFPRQVTDLLGFLSGTLEPDHIFAGIRAQPGPPPVSIPEVWLLGSSDYSARLAASLGLPFAFADFFGNNGDYGPVVADLYRQEFQPSSRLGEPKINVAVHVLCAPTEEEARFLGSSRDLNTLAFRLGLQVGQGLLPPEEAAAYPLTPEARQYLDTIRQKHTDGDPQQVREGVLETAERYGTKDVSIVTYCYTLQDRVRSYELVAQAFGLAPEPGGHA